MLFLVFSALASTPDCGSLCRDLDAAEELCEGYYGDGDVLCEAIGTVDDHYCPDGQEVETCEGLCADIDTLDDTCDTTLGESHEVCQALDALADGVCEAEEEGEDGEEEDDGDEDDGDDDDGDEDDEDGGDTTADAAPPSPEARAVGCQTGALGTTIAFPGLVLAAWVLRRR